ncbi:MAG: conserved rane protein of unknown function [Acidimicrobiia bacterium]|nr:conserved rane protein of unknown function [Acidimicrobiia bacterium]
MNRIIGWWTTPVARGRIAALRLLAYAFIPVDIFLTSTWVEKHSNAPTSFYRPLEVERLLPLPVPTHDLVVGVRGALVLAALLALSGRLPRLLGAVVAVLYTEWMFIAMSYGKIDHDRFAFLVLLAVLPTIGRAKLGDETAVGEAGWAVRMVEVAVIATYFLASIAKLRIGGLAWLTGSTLSWAILRRGTGFSNWLLDVPWLLRILQWFIVAFELCSPIVLFLRRQRTRNFAVAGLVAFHLVTFLALHIIFLPHLVAMMAFLPLERLGRRRYVAAIEPARAGAGVALPSATSSLSVTNR